MPVSIPGIVMEHRAQIHPRWDWTGIGPFPRIPIGEIILIVPRSTAQIKPKTGTWDERQLYMKEKGVKSMTTNNAPQAAPPSFPELSSKFDLQWQALLEDQIIVIDNILSPAECKSFVKFIDSLPLELTPPKKRGEAERHNHRYSITSVDFAKRLHDVFTPHLPPFLPAKPGKGSATVGPAREAHSFNSNIRVYKYTPLQHFGPHYDDDCRDPVTGAKSEWTLLLYLTGYEDGVEGGETLFYQTGKGTSKNVIKAPLTRGTALLHRHGRDCMLHEGSPVLKGVKYVLRSDVMFLG